jgi:hypothetical protein
VKLKVGLLLEVAKDGNCWGIEKCVFFLEIGIVGVLGLGDGKF